MVVNYGLFTICVKVCGQNWAVITNPKFNHLYSFVEQSLFVAMLKFRDDIRCRYTYTSTAVKTLSIIHIILA